MRALIGVAGGIGSGKSSIASALADNLDGQKRSFGDAVRAESHRRGLGQDRTALQDLGNVLIGEGWAPFVGLVMDTVTPDVDVVVVDGVRHRDAIEALRPFSGNRTVLTIFVRTSVELRIKRLMTRDGTTRGQVEAAMAHRNECDVESLLDLTDLVVDNDQPLNIAGLAARVREMLT